MEHTKMVRFCAASHAKKPFWWQRSRARWLLTGAQGNNLQRLSDDGSSGLYSTYEHDAAEVNASFACGVLHSFLHYQAIATVVQHVH